MPQIPNENKYDLEERTVDFGEDVIKLCQKAKELNLIFNSIYRKIKK